MEESGYTIIIQKKLFPGVKTGQSAVDRLEACNVSRVMTMDISTRASGFSFVNIFYCLFEFNNVPMNGSIYQLYRVGLAALECKVVIANRDVCGIQDSEDDYAPLHRNNDFVIRAIGITVLPDQLTSVINAVGNEKCIDKLRVLKIGRDNHTRQLFIPHSEHVTFSNLRNVVTSLANPETPGDYRRRFYYTR